MTSTTQNTIYIVYSFTPKGSWTTKYRGENENKALEIYGKLIDQDKPRLLNRDEGHGEQNVMTWGMGI